ncbi:uncharacterized protein TRIADDRAFT_58116 [Trichoplax adhaerens]|uniref:Cadherin domain-containing protein n=1 Tax=Trichoplax adhaerens TaxID=10228 RepID=B3S2R1_TRIAD|nr:hypothetical protein TRIADDRAFT_58116 [Trichoplax adhaerens]EDV23465.1 hypothetical protein TRIADDRAFT_58116 [Trichoplax adhaerens]|eukprot:XP_002114375.1 hypothetical protein TRIADDRAFT_58116 [Trichoplax adhaerens]
MSTLLKGKSIVLLLSVLATIQINQCLALLDKTWKNERILDGKTDLQSHQDLSWNLLTRKNDDNRRRHPSIPYGIPSGNNPHRPSPLHHQNSNSLQDRPRREVPSNNQRPNFTSRFYYKSIECALQHESIVVTVGAKVPDGSIIRYSIDSGNEDGLFFIGELNGNIRLLATPRIQDYELIVRATVNSNLNLHNTVQVYIHVYFPGGAPIFRQPLYQVNVTEQLPANTPMIRIEALSDDKITYAIASGNKHSSFAIGQNNGNLNTTRALVYSPTSNTFTLIVSAKDISERISTIKVIIHVVRSPFRPLFQPTQSSHHPWKGIYHDNVSENATIGSAILRVHASTILSARMNDQITYYIASGNHNHSFLLNPNTGYLTVAKALDRERQSSYQFSIRATSKKHPMLYDDAVVKITVIDVNDNAPKFNASCLTDEKSRKFAAQRRQGLCMRLINENAAIGEIVLAVIATDPDSGNNGKIIYTIVDGNIGDTFLINAKTGYITLRRHLDRETVAAYRLTIQAADEGIPSRNSKIDVSVYVSDINDNPPKVNASSLVGM